MTDGRSNRPPHQKNRGRAAATRRDSPWIVVAASIALCLLPAIGLWLAIAVSTARGDEPVCDLAAATTHAPADTISDPAYQANLGAQRGAEGCIATRDGLSTLAALDTISRDRLSQLVTAVGTCAADGELAACEDDGPTVTSWLRRQVTAQHEATDRLDAIRARLDVIASNTTPASTTTPGSSVVTLSGDDRALASDNDRELAYILWLLVGVGVVTPLATRLLAEVRV
jgi:hypothetical protein